MAFDVNKDYSAIKNQLKKQMDETTDPALKAQLQAQWNTADGERTEKLASNLSKYGKWASDSELDSAAGLMAQTQIGTAFETQKENLNKSYDQAKQNASNDALSRGMARSSYAQDRAAGLDSERSNALSGIDASKAAAIQSAKQTILNQYQTNMENKLAAEKNEFAQNIGAYHADYQAEINRIQGQDDRSEDWKIPYLQAARQQKIAGNAEMNMKYGDFSGAGSLGLSPEAIANAQGIYQKQYPYLFAPTYSGGGYYGDGTSTTSTPTGKVSKGAPGTNQTAPIGNTPTASPSTSGMSAQGRQMLTQVQGMQKQGAPSTTIVNEVNRAVRGGVVSTSDANKILGAIGL